MANHLAANHGTERPPDANRRGDTSPAGRRPARPCHHNTPDCTGDITVAAGLVPRLLRLRGAVPPAPKVADIDIGVVYTYEQQYMPKLLTTLRNSADGVSLRLLLVDNASTDGADQWRPYFPGLTVLRNDLRLHYAANLNRVLAASTAPYVLLLNTDMYFDPAEQCLAKMLRFMRSRPDCGIAGCRLLRGDGSHAPSARRFQTLSVILARRCGLGGILSGTLNDYFYAEHSVDQSWSCDWLSGCFLMVRRAAFDDVGYFDAGFIKYFEDVDICLRMARAGWQVMYHGGTSCYHLEQRASVRWFSVDARRHLRSYLRWLWKWGFSPERAIRTGRELRRAA